MDNWIKNLKNDNMKKTITLLAFTLLSAIFFGYVRILPFLPLILGAQHHSHGRHHGNMSMAQWLLMIFCFMMPSIAYYIYRAVRWFTIPKKSRTTFFKFVIYSDFDNALVDGNTVYFCFLALITISLLLFAIISNYLNVPL